MADITQIITAFPDAPDSSTDTPSVFNTKANAFVDHQSGTYVGEVNTWATEANGLKVDMNQIKTDVDNIVATIPAGQINDSAISPTNVFSNQRSVELMQHRNILIDGEVGRINQSGFDGNWAGLANGAYGYDIWKSVNGNIYMYQPIEEGNYKPNAVYTLSGNGITTQQETSPSSGTWWVGGGGMFENQIPNTATNVQLELGTVATEFEILPYSDQLARVQRYYEVLDVLSYPPVDNSNNVVYNIKYIFKASTPAITILMSSGTLSNSNNNKSFFRAWAADTGAVINILKIDARL